MPDELFGEGRSLIAQLSALVTSTGDYALAAKRVGVHDRRAETPAFGRAQEGVSEGVS
jgi:hypothetical protein